MHVLVNICELYCFVCGINSIIDPGLSIVLIFHVRNANSVASLHSHLIPFPRLWLKFHNTYVVWDGVVSFMPTPQPGGPEYPFLSGSSPLTFLAWEALPVAQLSPA